MLISTVARLAGCSERAIRHYHHIGLLAEPPRRSNGYRDYQISDLNRVLTIRALLDAGIPLAEIGSTVDFPAALSRIDATIARLQQQRANLLRLSKIPLGVPAELLQTLERFLRDCMFPEVLIDYELDTFQLMGICGIATPTTWKQLALNLNNPAIADNVRQQAALWHRLKELTPESEEYAQLIAQIATLLPTGLLCELYPTLKDGNLPLSSTDFELPYPYDHALERLMELMKP